jgi:hypothetical protein
MIYGLYSGGSSMTTRREWLAMGDRLRYGHGLT